MPVPPEIAAACPDAAAAGPDDAIAGCPARYVAAPSSTQQAAALLAAAAALELTVVPRGAGRLQHWGRPPQRCDLVVDTRRLNQIVRHNPDECAVTVQAGVRDGTLAEMLNGSGQRLAILPPLTARFGTIGGLIATNAAGTPWRRPYGTPRDQLTGVTAVLADGTIVRSSDTAGGTDLARLFAGSYGTLGLITEATLRLHPLPGVSGSVRVPCSGPEQVARIAETVCDPWLASTGIEVRWPSAGGPITLDVCIEGGDGDQYRERCNWLNALAGWPALPENWLDPVDAPKATGPLPEHIQAMLDDPPRDTGTLLRVSFPPAALAAALTAIRASAAQTAADAAVAGEATAGILEVKLPADTTPLLASQFVAALSFALQAAVAAGGAPGETGVTLRYGPDDVRAALAGREPAASLEAIRSVKDRFDPAHRMAPGRIAEAA